MFSLNKERRKLVYLSQVCQVLLFIENMVQVACNDGVTVGDVGLYWRTKHQAKLLLCTRHLTATASRCFLLVWCLVVNCGLELRRKIKSKSPN